MSNMLVCAISDVNNETGTIQTAEIHEEYLTNKLLAQIISGTVKEKDNT